MFCVNCGKDIPENSYICHYCKFVLNKDYEQTNNSSGKKQESIPIKSVIKFIAEVIVVIICVAGGVKLKHMATEFNYIDQIQCGKPSGYNITYQQAFSRYFRNCDWEYEKDGSIKRVRFTGITSDNENVDIVFNITDVDDGFYYNVENIIVDGVRIENVLGDYGLGLAIEEIFESY